MEEQRSDSRRLWIASGRLGSRRESLQNSVLARRRYAHEATRQIGGYSWIGPTGNIRNRARTASCRPPTTTRHHTMTRPPTGGRPHRVKDCLDRLWGLERLELRAGRRVLEDPRDQLAQQDLLRRPGWLGRPRPCRLFHPWLRAGLEVPVAPRSSRQGLMRSEAQWPSRCAYNFPACHGTRLRSSGRLALVNVDCSSKRGRPQIRIQALSISIQTDINPAVPKLLKNILRTENKQCTLL